MNQMTNRPPLCIRSGRLIKCLFFAALICLQFSPSQAGTVEKSSYKDNNYILELNATNFDSCVYNQSRAFFVEFYASWCGHCMHYMPTFVKFATNLRAWSNTLQVAVIDCAAEENGPICRTHAISALPTLKYFRVDSKSRDDAGQFNGNSHNLAEMTRLVAGLVHKDYVKHNPVGWPKLEPSPSSLTLPDLWNNVLPSSSIVVLVVDKEPYGDGYATMINYHNNPHAHVVVVDASHKLATQFGNVAVPAVHIFERENPHSPIFSSSEAVDFEKIQTEVDKLVEKFEVEKQVVQLSVHDHEVVQKSEEWNQFEVQYLDLTSTLSYMLTQEIPRREIIDGFYLKVLKDWIHVLQKYLPLASPAKQLLSRLDEYVKPLNVLKADDWLAHVQLCQDELDYPLPKSPTYLACRGSKPSLRGYNCGLWTLLHTITVEAYKQNENNPNFRPINDVLGPLHQFIYNYFFCNVCANHFNKMALETLPAVKTPEDIVLWLWRAHNQANKRLSGEDSDDPHYPKQQFPPASICSKCHLENGEFDEVEVLRFLTEYYSNIKMDHVQLEDDYKSENVNSTDHLSYIVNAQRSLIWMVTIVALLMIAYNVIKRNRSRILKVFYSDDKLFIL